MVQGKAVAYANNDVVQIGWSVDAKIPGCLGFAIFRIPADADVPEVPLTSHVGFDDGDSNEWISKPTTLQPIAAFRWRDLAPAREQSVRYKVVAMQGPSNNPQPVPGFKPLITNPVNATETYGKVKVFFNRGVLSTQHLSRALIKKGLKPNADALDNFIGKAGDDIRLGLTGELLAGLTSLLDRAKNDGGKCYAALYELTDDELIKKLAALPDVEIILSNNGTGGDGKPYDEGNRKAREALAAKGVIRRYMPTGQIGHNKFVVYVGPDNEPKAVMTGSTNWTPTGLCTQSNNVIVIESPELAKQYLAIWNDLKNDAMAAGIPAAPAPMKHIQGDILRTSDAASRQPILVQGGPSIHAWFSPNTKKLLPKGKLPDTPPDLKKLFALCDDAKQAVLFLCFQPGAVGSNVQTIVKYLSGVSERKPGLLIRGVISDQAEAEEFMAKRDPEEDADVLAPAGLLDGFAAWEKEFYKKGHAIVHDKIVVIDPFTDKCAVVTGSHNLGFRASHNNDENLLILKGDQRIAKAYATHVFDIYNHYRWRYYLMQKAQYLAKIDWLKDGGIKEHKRLFPASKYFKKVVSWKHNEPNDTWQDRYFDSSSMAMQERLFWVSEGQPLSPRVPKKPAGKHRGAIVLGMEKKTISPKAPKKAAKKPEKQGKKKTVSKAKNKKPAAKAKKISAKKNPAKKALAKKKAAKKTPSKKR